MRDTYGPRPIPPVPTVFAPGSPEKETVMITRLRDRYQLHHPADARYAGDTRPYQWLKWREMMKREADEAATQRILDKIKAKKSLEILGSLKKVGEKLSVGD